MLQIIRKNPGYCWLTAYDSGSQNAVPGPEAFILFLVNLETQMLLSYPKSVPSPHVIQMHTEVWEMLSQRIGILQNHEVKGECGQEQELL